MPSSPKIRKEEILKMAMDLLIREGYAAINIKTVAGEMGCSTQPISRQFGSMEGFRKELLLYCIEHLKQFFTVSGECVSDILSGIVKGYVTLAFDFPNLYKYLYMSEHQEEKLSTLIQTLRSDSYDKIIGMLQAEQGIPKAEAKEYISSLNYFVHGIASYVAVGFVETPKEEVLKKIEKVSEILLHNRKET